MKKTKEIPIVVLIGIMLGSIVTTALAANYIPKIKARIAFEQNVNKITQIDEAERQKEIDKMVEEGMINIRYNAHAVFNGTKSEIFNVQNSYNNHYPLVFSIYDENGDLIYESKQIAPGYELSTIELTKELSEGVHSCTIKISYSENSNVTSVFPITLEIK